MKEWTNHQVRVLCEMAALDKTAKQISEIVNRPLSGVRHKARQLGLTIVDSRGQEPQLTEREKDAKLGSQILREACMDMFQRTANRYYISVDDAMACHLGYHTPPRLIRAPYKTASALRRLAA